MFNLSSNKALVTGASKGLGNAISQRLAQLGCSVVLIARNEKLLKKTCENLAIVNPNQNHQFINYDLQNLKNSDSNDMKHKQLIDSLEDVSILINCAGLTTHSLLPRLTEDKIESVINLNLVTPIILSKLSYRPMIKTFNKISKESSSSSLSKPIILNISSVLSLTNNILPGTSVYAASKAGLLGFTTSLAAELKGKIRVNALLPGLIKETEMGSNANINNELSPVSLDAVVQKTIEIVADESLNGECIIVDGKKSKVLS